MLKTMSRLYRILFSNNIKSLFFKTYLKEYGIDLSMIERSNVCPFCLKKYKNIYVHLSKCREAVIMLKEIEEVWKKAREEIHNIKKYSYYYYCRSCQRRFATFYDALVFIVRQYIKQ